MSHISGLEGIYALSDATQLHRPVTEEPPLTPEPAVSIDDYNGLFRSEETRTSDGRYVIQTGADGVQYIDIPDELASEMGIEVVLPAAPSVELPQPQQVAEPLLPSSSEAVSDHTSVFHIVRHRDDRYDLNLQGIRLNDPSAQRMLAAIAGVTPAPAAAPEHIAPVYETVSSTTAEPLLESTVPAASLDTLQSVMVENQAQHDPALTRKRMIKAAKIAGVVGLVILPTRLWQATSGGDAFLDFYHPTHLIEKPYGDVAPYIDGILRVVGVQR